jgi:hypothetical protein
MAWMTTLVIGMMTFSSCTGAQEGKLSESEWKNALGFVETTNFTAASGKAHEENGELVTSEKMVFQTDGTKIWVKETDNASDVTYYARDTEGGDYLYLYNSSQDAWVRKATAEGEGVSYGLTVMKGYAENLKGAYKQFSYDKESDAYTAKTVTADGMTLKNVTVTFDGTALKSILFDEGENDPTTYAVVYSYYGETSVTIPDATTLKGQIVTADEWKTMLDFSNVTNYTVKLQSTFTANKVRGDEETDVYIDGDTAWAVDDSSVFQTQTVNGLEFEQLVSGDTLYYGLDGGTMYEYDYDSSTKTWERWLDSEEGDFYFDSYKEMAEEFKDLYDKFAYDKYTSAYTAKNLTIEEDGEEVTYAQVSVLFEDGKLARLELHTTMLSIIGTVITIDYSDYGTTTVTLPEATTVESDGKSLLDQLKDLIGRI